MNIEQYIKELAPELQEKAIACGSIEELIALAREQKIPVPDEALEAIAGGADQEALGCKQDTCPSCGSTNVESTDMVSYWEEKCLDCGCIWYE